MSRRRVLWLSLFLAIVLCVTAILIALPEVIRRVAVARIAAATGRAVALDDVDLNVFTGRIALKGFRLSQRGSPDVALGFQRLDVGLALTSFFSKHAHLTELALTGPAVTVTRTGPDTFDFSDLLELIPAGDPNQPSVWTVTVDHLALRDGKIIARDRVTSPPGEWRIEGLSLECRGLTTQASATPGQVALKARLNGQGVEVTANTVRLDSGAVAARIGIAAVDLGAIAPYVPTTLPVLPKGGTISLTFDVSVDRGGDRWPSGSVKGEIRMKDVEVVRRDDRAPVVSLARGAVAIDRLDLKTLALTLGSIELDGLTVAANRGSDGAIDLLTLFSGQGAAATPTVTASPGKKTSPSVKLGRVALRGGTFTIVDHGVSPPATFVASSIDVAVRDLVWPGNQPLAYEVALGMPGGGKLTASGTATLDPVETELTVSMRDAPIDPYGPYFPFRARFSGRFNADSQSHVRIVDGAVVATSKGKTWIVGLAARDLAAPSGSKAPLQSDRIELSGFEFATPDRARIARVTITRPDVRLERDANGTIPLRAMFMAPGGAAAAPAPAPAKSDTPPKQPITMNVGRLVVEDGRAAFVDRTVQPVFSETLSRLRVSIDGLSTAPGRRAKVNAQGVVGTDAALEISGEIAPLGDLFADLTVDIRDFALPGVSPYAQSAIAWVVERGRMTAKVRYRVERSRLTAENHVVVGDLEVTKAPGFDTAEQRLGLPLGMVVALIKDGQGRIVLDVPVTGSLDDPRFDWGETIWTAVRNVLVNVAAAPFRSIGRLFTGDDNRIQKLGVEPVTSEPGRSELTPDMQQHVARVAEFLRNTPGIALTLTPVITPEDVDTLRREPLNARLEGIQKAKGLPDRASAIASEFRARFPGTPPPPSPDEQFDRLLELEPPADERAAALATQRQEAVRDALVKAGIAPERLSTGERKTSDADTGRVELAIAPLR